MLQRVEPYVAFGYPNLKSVKELIYKRGYAKVSNSHCNALVSALDCGFPSPCLLFYPWFLEKCEKAKSWRRLTAEWIQPRVQGMNLELRSFKTNKIYVDFNEVYNRAH